MSKIHSQARICNRAKGRGAKDGGNKHQIAEERKRVIVSFNLSEVETRVPLLIRILRARVSQVRVRFERFREDRSRSRDGKSRNATREIECSAAPPSSD